ncbi:MAG: hypothetical protein M0Z54_10710 [Thermaerobacter sp.]|nr:hypothetical protein [Thermaerobacter sp.]
MASAATFLMDGALAAADLGMVRRASYTLWAAARRGARFLGVPAALWAPNLL